MNILVAIASSIIFIVSTFACDNSVYPIGAGFITSPNYPSNYDNNAQCSYFLQADQLNTTPAKLSNNATWSGDDNSTWPYDNYTIVIGGGKSSVLQLIFSDFVTEACCDLLFILDGRSIHSPVIKRLSGNHENNTKLAFESTQPYMTLNFITDQTTTRRGFRAIYQSKALLCTGCPDLFLNTSTIPGSSNGNTTVTYSGGVPGCRTGTALVTCSDPAGMAQAVIYAMIPSLDTATPFEMNGVQTGSNVTAEVICVNGVYQIGLIGAPVNQTYPFTSVECSLA